ncbi:MAG: sodium-extruding oxaloacetate decarboxylase subunit alpha [Magnetococcales bacterium]|nr:sodium-extruding oxaloacetate decarboxylase subunit alpha [Magnetococcales bacterium]
MERQPLGITELVLRDAHQSLHATRMRIDDMLPVAEQLDKIGYWSLEVWGGATFDSCIRFLGEDPWERLRRLRKAMPNTRLQMLFRGQNILGYRHYADDVVEKFVERAAANGMDVFRIFDAMNDVRNLEAAVKATIKVGKHAQGTMSYTISPMHDVNYWVDMGKKLEDLGCHSICIKDMAGLLKPFVAEELVTRLKETVSLPLALHSHATTGMSTAAIVKAAEAGIDMVDSDISSMSHTTAHSATESIVAIFEDTVRSTGLKLEPLEEIASYFRTIRKKYAAFEGTLMGVDSRILLAQVPGGMLSNMENQLRQQGALNKMDEVLAEIPKVREDLGFIPLVTPTSQIVGTQAVFNVLSGERYKTITKETQGILKGEYGAATSPMDKALQERVLNGAEPITCRPADLLEPEVERLTTELEGLVKEKGIRKGEHFIDDVLTYALLPQVGLKFLENRDNPDAFEPVPDEEPTVDATPATKPAAATPASDAAERYRVVVNGSAYDVEVGPGGDVTSASPSAAAPTAAPAPAAPAGGEPFASPLAGNVWKQVAQEGDTIQKDDVFLIMESMKVEVEVLSPRGGTISKIMVREGDAVQVGDHLAIIG